MICTCLQNKTYEELVRILDSGEVEMAEIRLDRCKLRDEEIEDLFANSDIPLIATCHIDEVGADESARRLVMAIEAGARFADLELEAPASMSREIQKLCRKCGTELIRSYHNFVETPDDEVLHMALARCFRYGADIAKIVTMCHRPEDAARIESLYSVVLEDVETLEGRLVAFGMGMEGRDTRLECLRRGSPFTYAAIASDEVTAPGQLTAAEMYSRIYGDGFSFFEDEICVPASKSFAQRAIIAAALAEGTSHLSGYTPCDDSEAAIKVAEALGATVGREDNTLIITGAGPSGKNLGLDTLDVGESGLLTRLMIPVLSAINGQSVEITGEKTLLRRPLGEAAGIMAAFGVMLSNKEKHESKEVFVPVSVKGRLIPGTADVSGKGGSQLISGLLMALPLCDKESMVYVSEPKSIPYMYITLDVLRHFGIQTRSEMEGNAEMLEQQDWTYCDGITFRIRGGQQYKAADFSIEGDWSSAANYLVAGAVFGSAEVRGLDMQSIQADITICDILVNAGAVVSEVETEEGDTAICVRKAPLEAFETDLSHAPDLFPIVSVLAAFCAGVSRISGIARLLGKESNRAEAILQMLTRMGVEAEIEDDTLVIAGEPLAGRILGERLLRGGEYTSSHDHRMVMALKVAALGADSPITIDDEACVSKSYPGFTEIFK